MKLMELWRWRYRDNQTGQICRTPFQMTAAQAAQFAGVPEPEPVAQRNDSRHSPGSESIGNSSTSSPCSRSSDESRQISRTSGGSSAFGSVSSKSAPAGGRVRPVVLTDGG